MIRAYSDLLKDIKFNQPIKILELGSGSGFTDQWLCGKYPVKKLTLVDFKQKMINLSKTTLTEISCQKEFINQDFFKIKLSEKYDLVHSQGVIEHFTPEKRLELLKLHYRATKPSGYCIVYSPTPTKSYCFFRKMAEVFRAWIFYDEVPLKKNIIINEMESLGFKAIKVNYFWPYFLTEVGIIFQKI